MTISLSSISMSLKGASFLFKKIGTLKDSRSCLYYFNVAATKRKYYCSCRAATAHTGNNNKCL